MHIAVDGRNLVSELSGLSRYLLEISAALSGRGHEISILLPADPSTRSALPADVHLDIARFNGAMGRFLWSASLLPARVRRLNADVFWGPAHRLPPFLPASLARVVTIHDLVWRRVPETMRLKGLIAERMLMGPSIRQADIVCAVSQATVGDIVEYFPGVRDRVRLVPPPVAALSEKSAGLRNARRRFEEPYVLFVGTIEPRKNVEGLIAAFAQLPAATRAACRLVICGGRGWRSREPAVLAGEAGIADRVTVIGHAGDEELASLYAGARCLALPSFHEGFGLPIVEAQRFGVPVITSDRSSMPEVAGEGGLLVDPNDPRSISAALERLFHDDALHADLSSRALANSARFSVERSAIAMEEALEAAVVATRRRR